MREETGKKEEETKTKIIFSNTPQNRHVSHFPLALLSFTKKVTALPLMIPLAGHESDPVSNPFSGSSPRLANRLVSVILCFLFSFALMKV